MKSKNVYFLFSGCIQSPLLKAKDLFSLWLSIYWVIYMLRNSRKSIVIRDLKNISSEKLYLYWFLVCMSYKFSRHLSLLLSLSHLLVGKF